MYDGLSDSVTKITWRKHSSKFLFHIADAPPHGKDYEVKGLLDNFPDGCPCKLTLRDIAKDMKSLGVMYQLLRVVHDINRWTKLENQKLYMKVN